MVPCLLTFCNNYTYSAALTFINIYLLFIIKVKFIFYHFLDLD